MLKPDIFQQVTKIWLSHLLTSVSRLNPQVSFYAYWGPDPGTIYVDGFFDYMGSTIFLCFSPIYFDCSLSAQDREGGSRGQNDCSLWPIQPYTAGATDSRCDKDTATDHDHAEN